MTNVRILQERPEIENGWVVRADSKRFGKDAIMFEGSYDDCIKYDNRRFADPSVESIETYIKGYFPKYGFSIDDTIILHRNGFEEHLSGDYGDFEEPEYRAFLPHV